nr:Uma2 family endonuclease [Streptacidiphilus melanogenes]
MSAMTQEAIPAESDLLESFLALETPRGFRAELIEGRILVSPPPDGDHQDIIELITHQVYRRALVSMQQSGNTGLKLPGSPKNHVIPDITFAPRELRLFRGAPPWMASDGVAMVVEVTSTRPSDDRTVKRHCYAQAAIPLYLIVDRTEGQVVLYSGPSGDDYLHGTTVAFGESLPLPEPFGFALETSDFL